MVHTWFLAVWHTASASVAKVVVDCTGTGPGVCRPTGTAGGTAVVAGGAAVSFTEVDPMTGFLGSLAEWVNRISVIAICVFKISGFLSIVAHVHVGTAKVLGVIIGPGKLIAGYG